MNYQSEIPNQRLTLISKNGSIHLGWVEDTPPQPSPTEIHSSGIAVSTPIYITLTSDQRKALLNRFRQIKQEQIATTNCLVNDPGEASRQPDGTDAQATGLTPVEDFLGMPEEHLNLAWFFPAR